MVANFNPLRNWRYHFSGQPPTPPLARPNLAQLAKPRAELPQFVRDSTLPQHYSTLLGQLD